MTAVSYHAQTPEEVLRHLETSRDGLNTGAVIARKKKFGPNAFLAEPKIHSLKVFGRQFTSALVLLLIAAGVISFYLGEHTSVQIIGITVLLTVFFGFFQEAKAERSLAALRSTIRPLARVRRDGVEQVVQAVELVPGDLVYVASGDRVPADLRLIEARDVTTLEAILTGESLPVKKQVSPVSADTVQAERMSMLFAGSTVSSGEGIGVVVTIGEETEMGAIARGLRTIVEEPSLLQEQIRRLSITITVIVCASATVIAIIGATRGLGVSAILFLGVAIAVAAIPEGLVVSVTVILTIGMVHLLRAKALVRQLSAAESLGAVSVLCLDKTGTITEGRMALTTLVGDQNRALDLIARGVSARVTNPHDAPGMWRVSGEGTEAALLAGALTRNQHDAYRTRVVYDDLPFSSERGYRAAIVELPPPSAGQAQGQSPAMIVIGAPERILEASTLISRDGRAVKITSDEREELQDAYAELGAKGMRTLAVATRPMEEGATFARVGKELHGLTFVALASLEDPVRPNAAALIRKLHTAGIRTTMITGDHALTAATIARSVGILSGTEQPITWNELSKLSGGAFSRAVSEHRVFARVPPSEKLRIVSAFQEGGAVVAMTGDGVNDAPALKRASIGVVMGSGTDVAKEVADLVLLDDNLETIARAVGGGRRIFENIRKVTLYLLKDSFREVYLIGTALLVGLPLPLIPAQILWVNLIEDTLPSFALAFEPQESRVMQEPPRVRTEQILGSRVRTFLFSYGAISGTLLLALFAYLHATNPNLAHVRTFIFTALGFDSLIMVFSLRRFRTSVFSMNPFGNRWLVGAVAIGFLMYLAGIYLPMLQKLLGTVPLGWYDWIMLTIFGAVELALADFLKMKMLAPKTHAHRHT